jgi:DNA-binding NarL/FixJ family response regulator
MRDATLPRGPDPTAAAERRALLVGQQLAAVDRLMPLLRRSNFDVRRTQRATGTIPLVREIHFDLLVVVLPFPDLRELLSAVRAEDSPNRNAAVMLVAGADEAQTRDELLMRLANRVLSAEAPIEELDKALTAMLHVAPRVSMRGAVRVRLAAQPAEAKVLRLENLSASGMLVTGKDPLPVGSLFGFELELPEQETPIRGQGRVVRLAAAPRHGEQRLGVTFVSVGGEGVEQLRSAVLRERSAAAGPQPLTAGMVAGRTAAPTASPRPSMVQADAPDDAPRRAVGGVRNDGDLAQLREEHAELSPLLDDLLRRGLSRRLGVADWYVTGVELGLESLAAFAGILETVYRGRSGPAETSRQIDDLVDVRRQLAAFADPGSPLPDRVEILVAIRPTLERLLRELVARDDAAEGKGRRHRGMVSQVVFDIQRVLRARGSLDRLHTLLLELQRPGYLFARGALRRRADEIAIQYRGYGSSLGVQTAEVLMSRRGRREALARAESEARRTDDWLGAIHRKVYVGRLRHVASGRFATDFAEERVYPVVADVLSHGYDYLVRAYSAYRHALEMSGTDAGLLDRVSGLAAAIAAAERRGLGGGSATGQGPALLA